jgi:hypothetical protein
VKGFGLLAEATVEARREAAAVEQPVESR